MEQWNERDPIETKLFQPFCLSKHWTDWLEVSEQGTLFGHQKKYMQISNQKGHALQSSIGRTKRGNSKVRA